MTSLHNAGVQLLPTVRSDVRRLAEITANSLDGTPTSQFLFVPTVYREGRRNAAVKAYFIWRTETAFEDPAAEVIKAVDQDSGEILGFATWQFSEGVPSTKTTSDITKASGPDRGGGSGEPRIVQDVNMDLMKDYFTSTGHNQTQIANAVKGKSSAYLWYLYVNPSTQQGGVGTLLMRWGLERADANGIASSVVSTPNARSFYLKFGFLEISYVDIDIAKVRGDFLGFGVWRQYGMPRTPGLARMT